MSEGDDRLKDEGNSLDCSEIVAPNRFDSFGNYLYPWQTMSLVTREYSKGQIDRAGEALITLPFGNPVRDSALTVINNWRSCHAYPLQIIKMTLLTRAKKIDSKALVAQRLKRLPSIALKLKQNPQMKLSQMQDIGGCRAVLRNVRYAHELVQLYEATKSKNPHDRPVLMEKYDYIAPPKEDGYRGIHLVYKYQSRSAKRIVFNGQRIEIQIRSKLQHIWATAVETAQTFTGQALKSRIKSASESWLRFFALMGSAIAAREKLPNVPRTPEDAGDRVDELSDIVKRENILDCLTAWKLTVESLTGKYVDRSSFKGVYAYLLVLDPTKMKLEVTPFTKDDVIASQEQYLRVEKATENDPQVQVVLVSVDSLDALRRAYPNYYADTTEFINAVRREIENT